MSRSSLFSQIFSTFRSSRNSQRRRKATARNLTSANIECFEQKMLLSGTNDLASLSDEFDDGTSTADWQRVNEAENWNADQLQTYDINQTQTGRMVMAPHSVVWYQNWRGPMAFKEVTGDFVFTTQVHITDRDDVGGSDADDIPNEAAFSLGGAMIRTPRNISDPTADWQPGSMQDDGTNNGENYVFLSMGHGTDGQFTFEVKTTRNSNSQLELTPMNSNTASVQLARIGNSIIALLQVPGQDWIVHRRYSRPDMPETLQVGLVSYSDWNKASDFDPFYHNSNVLDGTGFDPTPGEAYNPDLVAGYEYARYVRPQLPSELEGVDLVNAATDEQLLSFLGATANTPGDTGSGNDIPTVSVAPAAATLSESAGATSAFVVSRTGGTAEPLTVSYSTAGTAAAGSDFDALPGSVVIPAGATSAAIELNLTDDSVVEGAESLSVELLDEVAYELADPSASLTILDNDFQQIGDLFMSTEHDVLNVELPSAYPDGTALSYAVVTVGEVGSQEYSLDQQYDFFSNGNYYDNWGGQNERWLQTPNDGWFYLLPANTLFRWGGSFGASQHIADLPDGVYDDPSRLIDVEASTLAAITGHTLSINPDHGFAGTFELDVTKNNGHHQETERITVTVAAVQNDAPVFEAIADQTMSRGSELRVPISVSDPDGDTLTLSADVVQSELYELDQQYDFTSDGDYYENWGGQNERWLRAENDDNSWHYLLPNGELFRWGGSFAASELLAAAGEHVYDDPTLLTNAEPLDVVVAIDEHEVVIAAGAELAGSIDVLVNASDGIAMTDAVFTVEVSNSAPVLAPIGNLVISNADGTLVTSLSATDDDGDLLTWSVEVINSAAALLNAEFNFQTATDFYTDWGGQNEKWLRDSDGAWFFILPDGSFHRWSGSFSESELLTTLDSAFYDNPNLVAQAQLIPVAASIDGGTLNLSADAGFSASFQVLVTVSDGLLQTSQLVNVLFVL